jgi:hypothetical protein
MNYPLVSLVVAVGAATGAAAGGLLVRGTTAVPAAAWSVVAWLAVAAEMAMRWSGGLREPGFAASMRLVVMSLSLCPAMSLLGAKRPQHGVWQLIVGSLAVVLALPVGRAVVVMPGSMPDVHLLAEWFMLALALVGWMNFVVTRRGLAATLVTGGQLVLMRPFLPGLAIDAQIASVLGSPAIDCGAVFAGMLGTLIALLQGVRRGGLRQPAARSPHPLASVIDPPFLALRETLGAAWALRIAERFDQIAAARGWPCRLSFGGLCVNGPESDTAWHRDAPRAFTALMRRFVSVAWLRRHAGERTRLPQAP